MVPESTTAVVGSAEILSGCQGNACVTTKLRGCGPEHQPLLRSTVHAARRFRGVLRPSNASVTVVAFLPQSIVSYKQKIIPCQICHPPPFKPGSLYTSILCTPFLCLTNTCDMYELLIYCERQNTNTIRVRKLTLSHITAVLIQDKFVL